MDIRRFRCEDSRTSARLWLDINPEEANNSSRKFWIKATTIAHPWGFANNEGGVTALETLFTRLNTGGTRITQEELQLFCYKGILARNQD